MIHQPTHSAITTRSTMRRPSAMTPSRALGQAAGVRQENHLSPADLHVFGHFVKAPHHSVHLKGSLQPPGEPLKLPPGWGCEHESKVKVKLPPLGM